MAGKCPEHLEAEFIADCARYNVHVLAENYGKASSTIKDWRIGLYRAGKILWWPGIRMGDVVEYNDHIVLTGDSMVVSDLEVPYHDAELLGYLVAIAMKFGIKQLIIAGDFLTMDEFSFFPAEDTDFGDPTLADSLMEGGDVLESLFEWFDKIALIKGNHEQRGTRVREIGYFKLAQTQWEHLGDIEISYYKWCLLDDFRIEHPGNYSKIPGSVVRERAEIEGCSVLAGHGHHLSLSVTKNGRHLAVDLGHCTRPDTRYYKTVNSSTRHPKWVAGFWMIRNGHLYPFPKEFTDWDFWLGEVQLKGKKRKLWQR